MYTYSKIARFLNNQTLLILSVIEPTYSSISFDLVCKRDNAYCSYTVNFWETVYDQIPLLRQVFHRKNQNHGLCI